MSTKVSGPSEATPVVLSPDPEPPRPMPAADAALDRAAPAAQPNPFDLNGAHYPTAEEQKEISDLLWTFPNIGPVRRGIEIKNLEVVGAGAGRSGEVDMGTSDVASSTGGRSLADGEVIELANRLTKPLIETLRGLRPPERAGGTETRTEAEAMAIVSAQHDKFLGMYGDDVPHRLVLTTDPAEHTKGAVLVRFVDQADDGEQLLRTLIETECATCSQALSELDPAAKASVIALTTMSVLRTHGEQADEIAQFRVRGQFDPATNVMTLSRDSDRLADTATHELGHAYTHDAFYEAFRDNRFVKEGFAEYIVRPLIGRRPAYRAATKMVGSVQDSMTGPFLLTPVKGASAEQSIRQAMFRGRLDLIGWVPRSPAEAAAVADAGGSAPWNPKTAALFAEQYERDAQALQQDRSNSLGAGFDTEGRLSVQYRRSLLSSEPFARYRLLANGFGRVSTRGDGSLGVGLIGEVQDPRVFAQLGLSSSVDLATGRIDLEPTLGAGARVVDGLRIGAEAFALIPVSQAPDDAPVVPGLRLALSWEF